MNEELAMWKSLRVSQERLQEEGNGESLVQAFQGKGAVRD